MYDEHHFKFIISIRKNIKIVIFYFLFLFQTTWNVIYVNITNGNVLVLYMSNFSPNFQALLIQDVGKIKLF